VQYDEAGFRYALNEDAMATEKLAEGIRAFAPMPVLRAGAAPQHGVCAGVKDLSLRWRR
jgi:hypothetical protein